MLASSHTTAVAYHDGRTVPGVATHSLDHTVPPLTPRRTVSDPLAALESTATTLGVDKEQTIYTEGDPAEFAYRIVGGCVRMVKLMEDGRRQVTEFLLPGDLLGLDQFDTYDLSAEAVTPVVLRSYRRSSVEGLADRDPAIARRLRALAAAGLRAAWERMTLLGRKTAVERIASFLLEMSGRLPAGGTDRLVLPMGRADIADHLGLTMETVCRILSCLRQEGTIATGRSVNGAQVTIRNPPELRALACAARH
jgi:CRP/FNR family transcriptional regulator, nitrogen fixation regulation protein